MEKVKKTINFLGRLKGLGLFLGALMCILTQPRLGDIWSVILGTVAGVGFMFICENERKNVICDHVAEDLHGAMEKGGYSDAVFEIKLMKPGMIIRVYAIGADADKDALLCNNIIVKQIANSWDRERVWITQIVSVESEDDIEEARKALDDELIEDLKKMKNAAKKNGSNKDGE